MKASKFFNLFLSDNSDIKTISRMVLRQLGGTTADALRELSEVRDARDGWSGFIYYSDTCKFWARVRRYAVPYMEDEALDLGYDCALSMVKGFNIFQRDHEHTISDMARSLYGSLANSDTTVDNALAWYCLETVANRFQNWVYESDYSIEDITE